MEFDGKIGIVTGGARGIGKTIATSLKRVGTSVIIWDIDEEGEKTAEEIGAIFMKVDVSNLNDVKFALYKVLEDKKKIDILINNAGITRDNLVLRMSEEEFDSVMRVNLKGTFNTIHTVLRPMIKQRWGRIVNISSIVGLIGNAGQANYAASKSGMIGLTKSVAREVAKRGITVNAIAPGFIETEMTEKLSDDVKKAYLESIPMGRFGKPDDIANLILFLISDSASYITGQVLHIDGGIVM